MSINLLYFALLALALIGLVMIGYQNQKFAKRISGQYLELRNRAKSIAKTLWFIGALILLMESPLIFSGELVPKQRWISLAIILIAVIAIQIASNKRQLNAYNAGWTSSK